MKKVLFGTTNASKLGRLRSICKSLPIEVLGLNDLGIEAQVDEDGLTPRENATKKARSYFQIGNMPTFSIDAGLYIDKFPADKQPGLFVRRINGERATDEEMLQYYIRELERAGGESTGKWVISIALVRSETEIHTRDFVDRVLFTARRSRVIRPGEPLGSIQIDPVFNKYRSEITDDERSQLQTELDSGLFEFLKEFAC